jgi:molybdenum cofactor guanylyltransferase
VIAAILAGGRSRRMGRPKATVEFEGEPLIRRPLAAAAAAGLEPVVVAKRRSELPPLDVEVWHEPDAPSHPLVGLIAALERADAPVVAVACDMPVVTADALARLAAADGPAAPLVDGRLEPFPARYEPSGLPALRAALDREAPLRAVLDELGPTPIRLDPHTVTSFNTPNDLTAAAGRLNDAAGTGAPDDLRAAGGRLYDAAGDQRR